MPSWRATNLVYNKAWFAVHNECAHACVWLRAVLACVRMRRDMRFRVRSLRAGDARWLRGRDVRAAHVWIVGTSHHVALHLARRRRAVCGELIEARWDARRVALADGTRVALARALPSAIVTHIAQFARCVPPPPDLVCVGVHAFVRVWRNRSALRDNLKRSHARAPCVD